jgi:membrane associated rhomboid family serine protease
LEKEEKYKLLNALIYPAVIVGMMGIIHFSQFVFDWNLSVYGIYPRRLSGLVGVLFTPFLHGDFNHLFNNSISLLILGSSLFYFYKKISLKVFIWIYIMSGFWTWISARESYHIGASGIIYGLFSFLLISGFLRKNLQLIGVSFFVVFVYGSMVWGIFPIKVHISYEGHLWGFIAGIILAIYYKKQGPQKIEHVWDEEDDDIDEDNAYWKIERKSIISSPEINYIYKPKKEKEEE